MPSIRIKAECTTTFSNISSCSACSAPPASISNAARLLYQQRRYVQAEGELRAALAEDPHDLRARGLLALSLIQRQRAAESLAEAKACVAQAPDDPFAYNVLADVEFACQRFDNTERALKDSLRLNPNQPAALAALSACHFNRQQWREALAAAEAGLAHDPRHSDCLRLRSRALNRLGRADEAQATSLDALRAHPDDAQLWSLRGWQMLRANDAQAALETFQEALRLNPDSESAREGIVTALKGRYFIYRLLLPYFIWMASWSPRTRVLLVVLPIILVSRLGEILAKHPGVAALAMLSVIAYTAFMVCSWLADPVHHLLLRMSRFGRLSLTRDQWVESNWVGACALLGAVGLASWPITMSWSSPLLVLVAVVLMVSINATFTVPSGEGRKISAGITVAAAIFGLLSCCVLFFDSPPPGNSRADAARAALICFVLSFAMAFVGDGVRDCRTRKWRNICRRCRV